MATSLRRISGSPARQAIPPEPQLTEEQHAAFDRAFAELKASPAYYDARDNFALNAQVHMGRAS
ncbi:hypothetical protein D3C86_1091550 [compost metagenome]